VKLLGTVGPGAKIDLTTAAGKHVRSLAAGLYTFVVSDRAAAENFHLSGPGVNRRSGVAGKRTSRWTVRLKPGVYRYRSDEHAKVSGTFTVKSAG
jgi:hypothetical protein